MKLNPLSVKLMLSQPLTSRKILLTYGFLSVYGYDICTWPSMTIMVAVYLIFEQLDLFAQMLASMQQVTFPVS
ncbi:hypothetical protein FGO68_gene3729 [Halteria grandinella]|uniref:Uncharacterized protein n=1 Tax=Halteria grandinella TaxID=5974 RepID=A0A8J8NHK6_HALGN|nr:hypothetical protein FGO68_gene3729 [Halteria grandinella]